MEISNSTVKISSTQGSFCAQNQTGNMDKLKLTEYQKTLCYGYVMDINRKEGNL